MNAVDDIVYKDYVDESMIKDVMKLVGNDLSEPYSIFTYRFFVHEWPNLCICAYAKVCVSSILDFLTIYFIM